MKKIIIALVLPAVFLFACSENDDVMSPYQDFEPENLDNLSVTLLQSIETPYQSALQSSGGRTSNMDVRALMESLLAGAKVIDVSLEEERGLQLLELEIKMAQGGIVEVDILTDLSRIVELEGKRRPFNYQIDPMGSFITLADALSAAKAEIDGQMIRWELELEENNTWEYEFHLRFRGNLYEVEVDAFTSEIISIKEFDDEDEDNYDEYFENGDDDQAPQEIIDKALALLDGEIIYSENDDYEVYIETANGSVVSFEFDDDGELEAMEGEKGPFDYNFTVEGLISFTEAKNAALNEVDGTIEEWELELDDDEVYFEFEVELDGVEYEIKVDAVTGEVSEVEIDDEDDDDYDDD